MLITRCLHFEQLLFSLHLTRANPLLRLKGSIPGLNSIKTYVGEIYSLAFFAIELTEAISIAIFLSC